MDNGNDTSDSFFVLVVVVVRRSSRGLSVTLHTEQTLLHLYSLPHRVLD